MAPKLGIIAGGGSLPGRLIAACRDAGRPFFVLAMEGHADRAVIGPDAPQAWVRMGAAGTGIRLLKEAGCEHLVLAGPVRRPSLADLRPDWRTTRFFGRLGLRALGDDGLLTALIHELEADGFTVVGVDTILTDLKPEPGVLGRVEPDAQARADVARAVEVALALGRLDVGQAVVVQQGIVLGVEAVEGTDALLARCGGLRRAGPGGVLVKLCKPGQETRVDLPAVGPVTINNAAAAGLRGIAMHAGASVLVEREETLRRADAAGLFLMGVEVSA